MHATTASGLAAIAMLALTAGCGGKPPPVDSASATSSGDTAGPATPGEQSPPATAGAGAGESIPGLPPDAVRLPNDQGRSLWAVKLPSGRIMVYEQLEGGMLSGTGGEIADLPSIYPGVDFSMLGAE